MFIRDVTMPLFSVFLSCTFSPFFVMLSISPVRTLDDEAVCQTRVDWVVDNSHSEVQQETEERLWQQAARESVTDRSSIR